MRGGQELSVRSGSAGRVAETSRKPIPSSSTFVFIASYVVTRVAATLKPNMGKCPGHLTVSETAGLVADLEVTEPGNMILPNGVKVHGGWLATAAAKTCLIGSVAKR